MEETVRLEGNGIKPPPVEEESLEQTIIVEGLPVVPPKVVDALLRENSIANQERSESTAVAETALGFGGSKVTKKSKKKNLLLEIADLPKKNETTVFSTNGSVVRRQELALRIHLYNSRMGISDYMSEDLTDFVVRKREEHYIDKFKNQNALMKKFGEDGIKVYVVLDERKSVGQMLHESGVNEDKFIEILDFMDKEGMIKLEHVVPETALLKPVEPQKTERPVDEKRASAQPALHTALPKAPSTLEKIEITQQSEPDEDIRKQAPVDTEKKIPPVPGIMRDEHTSTPLPPEYRREKLIQPKEEIQTAQKRPSSIEITQAREEVGGGRELEAPKPEDLLSPLERMIYDKFGREGVEVYDLIDGEKTAEQILNETKISETKLVEILEFMDDEGIIKLDKPGRKEKEPEKAGQKEPPFEPILDDKRDYAHETLPQAEKSMIKPIMLPTKQPVGLFTRMETRLKLSLKYTGKGQKLLAAIDGKKDVVELSKELGISLDDIDRIMVSLTKRNIVSAIPLSESDIKDRYGSDGLKIFKRYGRDGIIIYELIGREKSLKDVILRSKVEPKRAVEIVMFIHEVLDLGLPLDKQVLYSQLGIKEKPT